MRIHALTATLLALLIATASVAADKAKKEGSFGAGKGTGAYLTKEQLRVCLDQQAHVKQQDADMVKERAGLDAAKAEIARSGDALKEKLEALDRTDAEAVAAYNDQAQARDKLIDDYQAHVTAFNARAEANKAEHEAYGKGCDNRRYFEEDEIAIKKGK